MLRNIMTNGNNKLSLKESTMATSIHEDTGFCSGEDYIEHEVHSPTDSSEDSVEVKVSTITLNNNKRKLVDNSRKETAFSGPLKKRMCLKLKAETDVVNSLGKTPFRPWSPPRSKAPILSIPPSVPKVSSNFAVPLPLKVESSNFSPVKREVSAFSYFRPPSPVSIAQPHQNEPVSLVIKHEKDEISTNVCDVRVPVHPQITKLTPAETERMILKTNSQFPGLQAPPKPMGPSVLPSYSHSNHSNNSSNSKKSEQKREQRNYKNMTRERRVEANARERTRVHTISAAFDTLRQAVPSYSHNQKLSKLSVLRIACSYIMTLSSLVQEGSGEESTPECVDLVSRTIQREGKLRKKKDDND